jgi:hypothetical protein
MIVPKELKLKNIQKVIDKAITPKCQLKWDISYEKIFNWISIGNLLLITLLTPWYDVCEIIMSDAMMNVHTCVTDTNFSCKYVYYMKRYLTGYQLVYTEQD